MRHIFALLLTLPLLSLPAAHAAAPRPQQVAYGADARQRFDIYLPSPAAAGTAPGAPVIFMVHGGAWRIGDKGNSAVTDNKVAHWVARGYVFISVNYRMLPDADPRVQAEDVAAALAAAQAQAASWGGDRARFVLMGHSAGAHLVALLSAAPALAQAQGATRWLGTVALDSAAYDIERIMRQPHLPLYDQAFGADPAFWRAVSPYAQLKQGGPPMLAVCSSQRRISCQQARDYADKAASLGGRVDVLPEDLSHRDINENLGRDGAYTQAVDAFLASIGASAR